MEQSGVSSEEGFILPALPSLTPCSSQLPEDYLSRSPTKRLNERLQEALVPPESPDMKFARNRLGNLLTSIRKGDAPPVITDRRENLFYDPDLEICEGRISYSFFIPEELDKRGPGRPRKCAYNYNRTKPGEVIFEMRGKPFSLREDRTSCTEYQLCRAWMRGSLKDDESREMDEGESPMPDDIPIELLVNRELASLPRAKSPYLVKNEWPDKEDLDEFDKTVNVLDERRLKEEYSRHWKAVKRSMKQHTKLRAQRYHRSTNLLEAIYHAQDL